MAASHNDFRPQVLRTLTTEEIVELALDMQEPAVEKLESHRLSEVPPTADQIRREHELLHQR